MDFYFEDQRPVPAPSQPKRGQAVVELPVSVAAKVLLLNEMLRQKVRPIEYVDFTFPRFASFTIVSSKISSS
jgi:ABC-type polysaccharide transport system permease subunit